MERGDLAPALDARPRRRLDLPGPRLAAHDAREDARQAGQVDRPHRVDALAQRVLVDLRACLLDVMALLLEGARGVLDRRARRGLGRRAEERLGGHRDAQRAGVAVEALGVRRRRARDVVPVARRRAVDGIEQQRGVAHRARDRELVCEAADRLAHGRPDRHAAARRLEPHQPAPRGRDADRPAAIVGVRQRQRARGHQRGRPAARPAGTALGVPRVARRTVDDRRGVDVEGELGRRGPHEREQAGRAEALGERGLAARDVAVEQPAAEAQRPPGLRQRVLDGERDAGQRAVTVGARVLVRPVHDRVELRVDCLDGAQRGLADLVGADVSGDEQPAQLGRVAGGVVGGVHQSCGARARLGATRGGSSGILG